VTELETRMKAIHLLSSRQVIYRIEPEAPRPEVSD
jgi:hypothetical protein